MFNPSSSSVEYSCNTHIEVCDDIAAHLKRDSSNFLTDVGLQGFNGLWVVVVHPLLQGCCSTPSPSGNSSNFLTDVGLQGFNGLWVVVVHPLLQVPP